VGNGIDFRHLTYSFQKACRVRALGEIGKYLLTVRTQYPKTWVATEIKKLNLNRFQRLVALIRQDGNQTIPEARTEGLVRRFPFILFLESLIQSDKLQNMRAGLLLGNRTGTDSQIRPP
jgi:hypothetical protein